MEFLHNDPTAHWFVVTAIDDDNVYVNDPWVDRANGKAPRDMTGVRIPRALFAGSRATARSASGRRCWCGGVPPR